jgi:hypothetical protein
MRLVVAVPSAFVLALVGPACAGEAESPQTEATSTDGASSDDGTASGSTAAGESTSTEGGRDDSGSDAASSTTGGALACTDVRDCRLLDDCCTCEALHVDEDVPPTCDLACDRTMCELWNTDLVCSHTCLLRLVDCDPALIMCDEPPPECGDGFQPAVEDRCWTQQCVPVALCTPY